MIEPCGVRPIRHGNIQLVFQLPDGRGYSMIRQWLNTPGNEFSPNFWWLLQVEPSTNDDPFDFGYLGPHEEHSFEWLEIEEVGKILEGVGQ